jgi:hypothetical protein
MNTINGTSVPDPQQQPKDVQEIAQLTPFKEDDLRGLTLKRGNMLGGASPLEASGTAPWATPAKK